MHRVPKLIGGVVLVVAMSGCVTSGLSLRESPQSFSRYVYALYDLPATGQERVAAPPVQFPMRLAVAQVGEVTPAVELLRPLQQDWRLSRVEGLPGPSQAQSSQMAWQPGRAEERGERAPEEARKEVERMLRLAQEAGFTHLFLCGGSVDYGTRATPLTILDLSIIGGYIIPSNEFKAVGKASGALIEVTTGRLVFLVSTEANDETMLTSNAAMSDVEPRLTKLKQTLAAKLTQAFLARLRQS